MHLGVKTSLTVALVLIAFACGDPAGVEDDGKSVDTNPQEPNPNIVTYQASIDVRVKPAVAPYTVTIEARNTANPAEKEIIGPKQVANGPFHTTVDYNQGRQVYIQLTIKTSKPGEKSDGYCIIKDGNFNVKEGELIGRTLSCILVTNRG